MKIWKYNKCGSCRKAISYLNNRGVEFEALEILENPPSEVELRRMLDFLGGNLKRMFNTSGVAYKEGNYKEKIKSFNEDEAIKELSGNGALIKRPFVLGDNFGVVGFKEEEWDSINF